MLNQKIKTVAKVYLNTQRLVLIGQHNVDNLHSAKPLMFLDEPTSVSCSLVCCFILVKDLKASWTAARHSVDPLKGTVSVMPRPLLSSPLLQMDLILIYLVVSSVHISCSETIVLRSNGIASQDWSLQSFGISCKHTRALLALLIYPVALSKFIIRVAATKCRFQFSELSARVANLSVYKIQPKLAAPNFFGRGCSSKNFK